MPDNFLQKSEPMKDESTGSSNEIGYKVEVRHAQFSASSPVILHDGLVGPDWRLAHFQKSNNPAGVPDRPFGLGSLYGLLTFEGATALAWTILAQNERHGLECRLVQYRLTTSHSLTREGILAQKISCDLNLRPELEPKNNEADAPEKSSQK